MIREGGGTAGYPEELGAALFVLELGDGEGLPVGLLGIEGWIFAMDVGVDFCDACGQLCVLLGVSGGVVDVVEGDAAVAWHVDAGFGQVVEKGGQAVVVFCGERIVFVIVTFCAAGGAAEPNGAERADMFAFECVEGFLIDHASFAVGFDEPVVARGDERLVGRLGEQVSGQLFDSELVKGHIVLESTDDVGAVGTRGDRLVADHSGGVGPADQVEPSDGLMFGVLERVDPFFDEGVEGLVGGVGFEASHVLESGRQASQIVAESADEFAGSCRGNGGDVLGRPGLLKEGVDCVGVGLGVFFVLGYVGLLEWTKGPMFFVGGPLFDPTAKGFSLLVG